MGSWWETANEKTVILYNALYETAASSGTTGPPGHGTSSRPCLGTCCVYGQKSYIYDGLGVYAGARAHAINNNGASHTPQSRIIHVCTMFQCVGSFFFFIDHLASDGFVRPSRWGRIFRHVLYDAVPPWYAPLLMTTRTYNRHRCDV